MKVKFFPKTTSIPVEVCDHRYDAEMTFSEQTDSRVLNSIYVVEALGFKHNVRLGAFQSNLVNQTDEGIFEAEQTGLIRHDIYFSTDRWKNPNTGLNEVLPDYYRTEWTAEGAEFFNVTVGESKASRYPNNGQQLYDISNGDYGYDIENNQIGASNLAEFLGIVDVQKEWLKELTGRNISAGSYRNGQQGTKEMQYPHYLGMRNSAAGGARTFTNSDTYYGESNQSNVVLGNKISSLPFREFFSSYPSSTRFWDYQKTFYTELMTKEEVDNYVLQELAKCTLDRGWFRDFTHWHFMRSDNSLNLMDDFLSLVRANTGFIHTCSNGEALEYMYLRQSCSRVVATEKSDGILITADVVDFLKDEGNSNFKHDVIFDAINTPLSLKIDLTGTILEGKNIKLNKGDVKSEGNDIYIIDLHFDKVEENIVSNFITEAETDAEYLNFEQPVATASITGSDATITISQACKVAVFESETDLYNCEIKTRINKFSTNHKVAIDASKNTWVGVINKAGQASLIEL